MSYSFDNVNRDRWNESEDLYHSVLDELAELSENYFEDVPIVDVELSEVY